MPGGAQSGDSASGGESDSSNARFTIQDTSRKFVLAAGNSAERILWLRNLDEARKHCLQTERAVLQRQRSSNASKKITSFNLSHTRCKARHENELQFLNPLTFILFISSIDQLDLFRRK